MIEKRELPLLVSTIPFTPESKEIEKLLKEGFGLEIFLDWPQWCDEYEIEEKIKKWRKDYGEFPVSIHATMIEGTDLTDPPESHTYQLTLAAFHRASQFASLIKALHVVIHTHGHHTLVTEDIKSVYQERVKKALPLLVKWAKDAGTEVGVENIGTEKNQTLLFNDKEYIQLFEDVKGIRSLIDIGHTHLNRWNIGKVIGKLEDKIISYHLHDNYGRDDNHYPMGKGWIPWEDFIGRIVNSTRATSLVLEFDNELAPNPVKSYLKAKKFIREAE